MNSRNKFRKTGIGFLFAMALSAGLLTTASAQRGWEVGGWLGGTYYFGDLNTNFNLSLPGLAGGAIVRRNFNERVSLKFSANYGILRGDDAVSNNIYERARNLSFRTPVFDGAAQLEFNFLPYKHGSQDEYFTPYLFAGLNVLHFNPQAEYEGDWVDLRPLGTEGQFRGEEYYSVSGGVLFGGGFKIDLSYEWSLNFEIAGRHTFTDYLDDVSTVYADKDDLLRDRGQMAVDLSDRSILIPGANDGQIGEPGTQRGDSTTKDVYVMMGVGLLYYFGNVRCPDHGSRKKRR